MQSFIESGIILKGRLPWLHSYARYNIDIMLRSYFSRSGINRTRWPLCLDMLAHGIFEQDASLNSTQGHDLGKY
eukprot:4462137-Pleurochrysis_carterae.AAC.2